MHRRIDQVHSAHVGTFDWILREGSFVDWLSHGRGVFHIAGKPGSGKSTLMRFLCYDPHTEERLEQWAASSRLVRANYFFWRHGESDLQRNLEGLFRGLLHDSLSQCPDLIPDVFLELWEASESSSTSWLTDSGLKLQKDQIRHAFYKMIKNRDLCCDRRFCFFIDGLDEYKETTREDYGDLVKLLFEWVDLAPQDVKMCVSSRELNIFEIGRLNLDPKLKLRLHQLTEKDIETLVRDRLSELFSSAEEENSLDLSFTKQAVIARADGVFLWVTLVLKSLREGWADGDTLPLLLEKVNSTPPELDDLFMELFMSVAEANKQRAYLLMAVALRFNDDGWSMSTLFYFFVTEFYSPGFINEHGDVVLDQSNNDERIAMVRRRIMAYSKGLLEVVEPEENVFGTRGDVIFAHRSVCDFLKLGNIRNIIREKVDSSDIHKAISLSYLAELRAVKRLDGRLHVLFSICKADWREDITPFLLGRIDEEIYQIQGNSRPEASSLATLDYSWFTINQQHGRQWDSGDLTCEAGKEGFLEYIKWKIYHHPSSLDSDKEAVGLFLACMLRWMTCGDQGTLSIMEFMLDSRLPPNAPAERWTIWQVVLVAPNDKGFNIPSWSPVRCSQLIEIFLLRGAETRISISYEREEDMLLARRNAGHSISEDQACDRVVLCVGKERICYKGWQPLGGGRRRLKSPILQDFIDQLKLPDAKRLKTMVDESSGDVKGGVGDFTPETSTPQLAEAPRIGSSGKTWAWLFGISGPFVMISIGQYEHARKVIFTNDT
ncbi:NACHT domain-containing protein [Fusarium sp. LHS14.1]|nr:NACHT domain-containing protein [Fusarium sp. LHS14.1]